MHCFRFYFCLVIDSVHLLFKSTQTFMEGRLGITILVFTIIAACSKMDYRDARHLKTSYEVPNHPQQAIYTSSWQTIPSWTKKKIGNASIFTYNDVAPELTEDIIKTGVVLVYARNLWPMDVAKDFDDKTEKPLLMPFYFLPYFEKPDYTEEWKYAAADKSIQLTLTVKGNGEAHQPSKNIQWRFIAIPSKTLKQKQQSIQTLHKLSYDEVVHLFQLSST